MASDTHVITRIGTPTATCLAFLTGSVALGWLAYNLGQLKRLDVDALTRTAANRESSLAPLANFCTHLADPAPVIGLTILCCLLGLMCGRPRQAAGAAALVAGASLTTMVLKSLLEYPRFDLALGPHQIAATAFPSGHSTAAMSVALAFALVTPSRLRPIAIPVLAFFAFTVGVFLVFLGDHFPSDVLGGWMVAAAWCSAAVAGLRASRLLRADSRVDRVSF